MERSEIRGFTIRVYGIIIDPDHRVLTTTETFRGRTFTKFPGGGLEWGEGPMETLRRELHEELNIKVTRAQHFFTLDFPVISAFDQNQQLLSIYYRIFEYFGTIPSQSQEENVLSLDWVPLKDLRKDHFTFPVDQHIVDLLKQTI